MKYVKVEDHKPHSGVDVHVVTINGVKGVAKYWDITGLWLTQDRKLLPHDTVKKWKYEEAVIV